jgi:CheY-like chemotaxis protein
MITGSKLIFLQTRHVGPKLDLGTVLTEPSTIAVVEDDLQVRNAIASLLRSSGLKAVTFDSGLAYLGRAEGFDVDAVITDYGMPGMTGLELLRRLRSDGDPTPVIIITALRQPEIESAARDAGALALLRKPFEHAVLLHLIDEALT